jgi:hypothetical protein
VQIFDNLKDYQLFIVYSCFLYKELNRARLRPDIRAYSRPLNHSASALREETKVAETPNPTRTLANVATVKGGERANTIDPGLQQN